ncbi:MAG TPA: MAPEG family protein [Marinagarivorans sp.]
MGSYFWFSVFVASNSLLLFMLAMRVSLLRLKLGISTGDGDNPQLFKAIRAHSNGVEQVPIFGLLVLALSFNQLRSDYLAALVIVFTLARVCHGLGMNYRIYRARQLGAGVTYLLQIAAAVILTIILLQ